MHLKPILTSMRASLLDQVRLVGEDDAVMDAAEHLVEALEPAVRLAAIELAEQAASEVRAQRPDCVVDVVMTDGEPSLRISDAPIANGDPVDEGFDARISLRLPPSLKATIEEAAGVAGESLNSWVVDAVGHHSRRKRDRTRKVDQSFNL